MLGFNPGDPWKHSSGPLRRSSRHKKMESQGPEIKKRGSKAGFAKNKLQLIRVGRRKTGDSEKGIIRISMWVYRGAG